MLARKLKDRRGASIIIALLVLLICVTAGAAAITAASANAGRYTHMRRDQQRYLAVSSAVKAVRAELAAGEFSASATMEESSSYTDPETGSISVGKFYTMKATSYDYTGAFRDWIKEDLGRCFKAREIPESWWSQTGASVPDPFSAVTYTGLGMDVDSDEPLLSQVKWELALAEDYTITARFWVEDEGSRYYPTVLTLPATRQEETTTQRIGAGQHWETVKTVKVTWPAADATIAQD